MRRTWQHQAGRVLCALCTLMLLPRAGATATGLPELAWAVQIQPKESVVFRGVANLDGFGKPGSMFYPGGLGVVGLLTGIAVHGMIAHSADEDRRSDLEKQSDKVLDPYRADLAGFTGDALAAAALSATTAGKPRLLAAPAQPGAEMVVHSTPVFSLTQDRTALVLDNSVVISRGNATYTNTVRVVSNPRSGAELQAYWGADQARALKAESTQLLAESLDLAVADAAAAQAKPQTPLAYRTVRYAMGSQQGFERAEVVNEKCGRAVLRNLRGWLMSVPLAKAQEPAGADCVAAAAPAQ